MRIKKEKINCTLKCNNNYFTTSRSSNVKHFWRGYYKCTNPTCSSSFVAFIQKIEANKDVNIRVTVENEGKHDAEELKIRITSNERLKLAKDLMIKGTLVVKSENIIFNEENIENIQSKLLYFYFFLATFAIIVVF